MTSERHNNDRTVPGAGIISLLLALRAAMAAMRIGIIGIYLFGLRTGRAIKLHKKGRDFRVPEKKGKKQKQKQKTKVGRG